MGGNGFFIYGLAADRTDGGKEIGLPIGPECINDAGGCGARLSAECFWSVAKTARK